MCDYSTYERAFIPTDTLCKDFLFNFADTFDGH